MECYGYVRVSAKDQNPDRQLTAMKEQKIKDKNIYLDKMSGQDFSRPQYIRLLKHLKQGDTRKVGYSYRGQAFRILPTDNVFESKNQIWQYMIDQYYYLMEKYSSYARKELETDFTMLQQWEA